MTAVSAIADQIKLQAASLGFDLCGVAAAGRSVHETHFRQWLANGNAGTMDWLTRRVEERCDPATYFPGVKSVICVGMNYHVPLEENAVDEPRGRIARYALGGDYHELISRKLHQLADWLKSIFPEIETRCGVDTAPIMERELAARAGIGWIGKNTCLINPGIGSWLFLGEVLTSLELPADILIGDHCGSCRRCLDACPTGALSEPYHLDARKCISYLTIEHSGPMNEVQQEATGEWLFGCDICQDVCPFNRRAPASAEPGFIPRFPAGSVVLSEVLAWRANEYNPRLSGSAMKRVKLPILQRNAEAMLMRSASTK